MSLRKNGPRLAAAASVEPDGCGPSQPTNERVVSPDHQARWYRGLPADPGGDARPRVERAAPRTPREESDPQAYPKHAAKPGVPASPDLPAVERAVLDYWAADKTFPALGRVRRPGGRETSTSSTTDRRSPTGCRTTATC